jgi:hypothetical protein
VRELCHLACLRTCDSPKGEMASWPWALSCLCGTSQPYDSVSRTRSGLDGSTGPRRCVKRGNVLSRTLGRATLNDWASELDPFRQSLLLLAPFVQGHLQTRAQARTLGRRLLLVVREFELCSGGWSGGTRPARFPDSGIRWFLGSISWRIRRQCLRDVHPRSAARFYELMKMRLADTSRCPPALALCLPPSHSIHDIPVVARLPECFG